MAFGLANQVPTPLQSPRMQQQQQQILQPRSVGQHQHRGAQVPPTSCHRSKTSVYRALSRLQAALSKLQPAGRRAAIEQLPTGVRPALLRHMVAARWAAVTAHHGNASGAVGRMHMPLGSLCKATHKAPIATAQQASPSTMHAESVPAAASTAAAKGFVAAATRAPDARKIGCMEGVRCVPTGQFQASIAFQHLLIRSRTSRTYEGAKRFHFALRVFRMAAVAKDASIGGLTAEEALYQAKEKALAASGLHEDDLRPSYCVSLSTGKWAGKVESPTTSSLQQALLWRRRLLSARSRTWSDFRAVWICVLVEGSSSRLSHADAADRVDAAARRRGGGRARRCERLQLLMERRTQAGACAAEKASQRAADVAKAAKAKVATVAQRLSALLEDPPPKGVCRQSPRRRKCH